MYILLPPALLEEYNSQQDQHEVMSAAPYVSRLACFQSSKPSVTSQHQSIFDKRVQTLCVNVSIQT